MPTPTAGPVVPNRLSFLPMQSEDDGASLDSLSKRADYGEVDDNVTVFAVIFLVVFIFGSLMVIAFLVSLLCKSGFCEFVKEGKTYRDSRALDKDGKDSTGVPSTIEVTLSASCDSDDIELGCNPIAESAEHHLIFAEEENSFSQMKPSLIQGGRIARLARNCRESQRKKVLTMDVKRAASKRSCALAYGMFYELFMIK